MALQLVINGVSEQEVQETIKKNTKGWRLFFEAPKGEDEFLNTFWGRPWDGTAENLKEIICSVCVRKETGRIKPNITVFMLNGQDRFAWCSWTRQLYDFVTGCYHDTPPKFARNITSLIDKLT